MITRDQQYVHCFHFGVNVSDLLTIVLNPEVFQVDEWVTVSLFIFWQDTKANWLDWYELESITFLLKIS